MPLLGLWEVNQNNQKKYYLILTDYATISHKSLSGSVFDYNHYEIPAYDLSSKQYFVFTDDEKVLADHTPGRFPVPEHATLSRSEVKGNLGLTENDLLRIQSNLFNLRWSREYNDGKPLGMTGRDFSAVQEDLDSLNNREKA